MELTGREIEEIKKKTYNLKSEFDASLDEMIKTNIKLLKKFGGFEIQGVIDNEPEIRKITWDYHKKDAKWIKNIAESSMKKEEFKNSPKDYKNCLYTVRMCEEFISLVDEELNKYN